MNGTTPAPGSSLVINPQSTGVLAPHTAPTDIMGMLGVVNREDLLAILKQAKREELTEKKNAINGRLQAAQKEQAALQQTLDAIGPARQKDISLVAYQDAAKELTHLGFGKLTVAITFTGRVDDEKHYAYQITIKDPSAPTYSQDKLEKSIVLPFDQDTKRLFREIANATRNVEEIQQELLAVKKDFANIPELVEAARAELARVMVGNVKGGEDLLNRLFKKRAVVSV
jgi:hypothetical protein